MAEIIINTNPSASYEDGDIVCAFNDRNISYTHASHICNHNYSGFNSSGLRPYGKSQRFLDCIYQYRFERLNTHQVRRVETDYTGSIISEETFGKPDIHVEEFLNRRIKSEKHRIFGTTGYEIWHGGTKDTSVEAVNFAWNMIQNSCDCRNTPGQCPCCGQDHTLWPLGRLEIRHFLCVGLEDFNEMEASALQSELTLEFQPEDIITDIDGNAVNPSWSSDGTWQHPTGGWLYRKDPDTNIVQAYFKKRNMKVNDWRTSVLDTIQKTESEVLDLDTPIGRERMCNCDNAPWQRGDGTTYNILDHVPFNDPSVLYNKRDNQPGQRIPQGE